MEFIPHPYQEKGIDLMVECPFLALFLDPGLGKTAITLSALKRLQKRTLLIAPLNVVYRVWPKEIKKWDHTNSIKNTILHGPNKEKAFLSKAGIYIINPEGLRWLTKMIRKHRRFPFDVLVIDESTDFKNPTSKRFIDHLVPLLPNFERRYILSGTPIAKSYLDLWSQYYILDLGRRLEDNYYKYRGKYFYQSDYQGFSWDLFPGIEDTVKDLVADITYRVSGSDHLDLPEIFYNLIKISMPKKVRDPYKEMARELVVEFDNGQIAEAANAAVKSNKLQCICNGFLYISELDKKTGKNKIVDVRDIHTEKLSVLTSLVNELNGNPILVGYHYKHDLTLLKTVFPDAPYFGSGISEREKAKIESEWNAGNIPVLLAQIHSTAKGLNLQESGYHVFMYSLTWSWLDFTQFVQRVARQGQKSKRVIVHLPMFENSIDELIHKSLQTRDTQSQEFLNAFVDHIRSYT